MYIRFFALCVYELVFDLVAFLWVFSWAAIPLTIGVFLGGGWQSLVFGLGPASVFTALWWVLRRRLSQVRWARYQLQQRFIYARIGRQLRRAARR